MLILYKTICCYPSSEPSCRDSSDEGSQHMVSIRKLSLRCHQILFLSRALLMLQNYRGTASWRAIQKWSCSINCSNPSALTKAKLWNFGLCECTRVNEEQQKLSQNKHWYSPSTCLLLWDPALLFILFCFRFFELQIIVSVYFGCPTGLPHHMPSVDLQARVWWK